MWEGVYSMFVHSDDVLSQASLCAWRVALVVHWEKYVDIDESR